MFATLALLLALHLPVSVEATRVSVRAEAGLERLAAHVAEIAPRDLERIEADLPDLPRWPRVEVRLVKRAEDLGSAGFGAPPWAIGVAYPERGVVVVAARGRNGELLDVDRTLAHELAHLALGKAVGNERVPRWLTEGFAYLHSSDLNLERTGSLISAVMAGNVKPLWELEATFPAEENEAALAYAQAYDLVSWMASRGRWSDERDNGDRSAFRQFLAELAAGQPLDEAARGAFGRRLVDLETEWLENVRDRYLLLPLAFGGGLLWGVGGILLVIGWWRRRRAARRTLARWDHEEAMARSMAAVAPSVSGASASPSAARSP